MNAVLTDEQLTMAGKPTEDRQRLDLRMDIEIRQRIKKMSSRVLGRENLTGYVIMAVLERLEADEAKYKQQRGRKANDN